MNAKRFKVARIASGLSLRDLSDKIDNLVSAQAISRYERNEIHPSPTVRSELAKVLNVTEDYLVREEGLELKTVGFRKKCIVSKKEENQVQNLTIRKLEKYLFIEDLLNLETTVWDRPRASPYKVVDIVETELIASFVRASWNLGFSPIPNLVDLLEERGVKVIAMKLKNIDGLSAQVSGYKHSLSPVIVVNSNQSGERQRFTLSHEFGHMVMSVASKINEETLANRFAGAFLMPSEIMRSEIGVHRSSIGWEELFNLKVLFGVSVQALIHRCRHLGIINCSYHQSFLKSFSSLGWSSPPYKEPGESTPEIPKRFERLCYRALSENLISEFEATELLGKTVPDLQKRINSPPEITQ